MKYSQKMPVYFIYTKVQKIKKWPKTQIRGSCLNTNVWCKPARPITLVARNKKSVIWTCYMLWSSNFQGISRNYYSFKILKIRGKVWVLTSWKSALMGRDWVSPNIEFSLWEIQFLKFSLWRWTKAVILPHPITEQNFEKCFRTRLTAHLVHFSGVASGRIFATEGFSKPNFGSIRRFRTMTGLEIENWIEKHGQTVRKFRSTRPKTESNFRFGLTSCRSQNLPTEVLSLLCQVFDSFSLVTSSSSHHVSHLRGFIRNMTRQNWSFHTTRLTMIFLLRQEIFGRYMAIISEWMGKRRWPWDHQWSRTWQKESPERAQFDKEHFIGTQGPRFSTARHQSSSAGHAIIWSIVFLFAERSVVCQPKFRYNFRPGPSRTESNIRFAKPL